MPHALSLNKTQAVKTLLQLDTPHDVIATKVKYSERSVRRISSNLVQFASVKAPKAARQGRPSTLTAEMVEVPYLPLQSEHSNGRAFSST